MNKDGNTSVTFHTDMNHLIVWMTGIWDLFTRGDSKDPIENKYVIVAIERVLDELIFCSNIDGDADEIQKLINSLKRSMENLQEIASKRQKPSDNNLPWAVITGSSTYNGPPVQAYNHEAQLPTETS